ncbi:MAG: tRNA lysidine(34) synthetase TilS [Hyphomicrobiaceae bacterium]
MSKTGNRPSAGARAAPRAGNHKAVVASPRTPTSRRDAAEAIGADEIEGLLGPSLSGFRCIIVGVSGGVDSVALMHLAALWCKRRGHRAPRLVAATVDHRLRAESAAEAAAVGVMAAALGIEHHILPWTGPKPSSGTQDAAREARYRLLGELADRLACPPSVIALAHHRDDQAETLLMRLARGSGIDGLAGMPPRRTLSAGSVTMVVRPLLDVPKVRLAATLTAAGAGWIEDPSNELPRFERVKLRKHTVTLAEAGLDNGHLALSARRLRRALTALQSATEELEAAAVDYHDGAYASIDHARFEGAPEELRLRLLQRVVLACGDRGAVPQMARLEALLGRLMAGETAAGTLAGCLVRRSRGWITAVREAGRTGLPKLELKPGERATWDRRFDVALSPAAAESVVVRPLAADGWRAIREAGAVPGKPVQLRTAMLCLPSFWVGDHLAGVPQLEYLDGHLLRARHWAISGERGPFDVRFISPV